MDNFSKLDNELVGKDIGLNADTAEDENKNGKIDVIADNDNIIAGDMAGIQIKGEHTVKIQAGTETIDGHNEPVKKSL